MAGKAPSQTPRSWTVEYRPTFERIQRRRCFVWHTIPMVFPLSRFRAMVARAPDGLEQTGSPELIPGPRIRSYDARPNSFLNGIGAGRPLHESRKPAHAARFCGLSGAVARRAPAWQAGLGSLGFHSDIAGGTVEDDAVL